jgi:hypothetical protein
MQVQRHPPDAGPPQDRPRLLGRQLSSKAARLAAPGPAAGPPQGRPRPLGGQRSGNAASVGAR